MNRRRKFLLLNGGAADTTKPTIAITSSQSSPTIANPIPITFTLSEVSTDFAIGDVTVGAGGTLSVDMQSHPGATPVALANSFSPFPEFGCFVIEKA